MKKEKELILNYLKSNQRKISVRELLGKLDSEGIKLSRRALRMVYEDMRKKDGCLVGSNNSGLFYIRDKKMLESDIRYKKATAAAIFEGANCLIDNWNKAMNDNVKQLEIFEVDKSVSYATYSNQIPANYKNLTA